MRALTAAELLRVWEHGTPLTPPRRALALLQAAAPEASIEQLGQLSVGQRDDLLLQVRAAAFGSQLEAIATCPHCHEQLEMSFSSDQLRAEPAPLVEAPLALACAGHELTFRLPNNFDLVEVSAASDLATAETLLLRRCILSARQGPHELNAAELPRPVIDALATRLAEADPQADLRLALACPACAHRWDETFDVVAFFWREIDAWAGRVLQDVHTLACAYGWTESEILALSPTRRRLYLERVAS